MIVLHLGACLNYYSLSSIPIVYLSLHSMIVSTHKNNLRLTTATHSSYNPTLVVTGTDMNTWSPLSNLFLPPPFSQTSSNLSPGGNLRHSPPSLRSTFRPDHSFAREGRRFTQLSLPLFPRTDAQLAEALSLPPLAMEHSFYMPISALPGLFSRLVSVPPLLDGPGWIQNFRTSPALPMKPMISPLFPLSSNYFSHISSPTP